MNAVGSSPNTRSARNAGIANDGQPLGMPWKRVSIVATARPSVCAAAVPARSATIVPGMRVFSVAQRINASSVHTPSAAVVASVVGSARPISTMRPTKSPGMRVMVRPRNSRSCVVAMMTAMPLVKPTTTGRGMKRMALPIPVRPRRTSITPAIIVHTNRPAMPCVATMPAATIRNAPVGPPIWTIDPPPAEMIAPVTIAQ